MSYDISPLIPHLKEKAVSADTLNRTQSRNACADFEALLLQQILEAARKNTLKGGLFDDSFATDMFKSMRNEEMAKGIAHSGGIGLGEALYRHLSGQIKPNGI